MGKSRFDSMNSAKKKYGVVLCSLLLVGCVSTPEYVRPTLPVAAAFPLAAAHTDAGKTPSLMRWQDYFADPHLQALIEAALRHNRSLQQAALRVAEARAQYGLVKAEALPSINATLGQSVSGRSAELAGAGNPRTERRADLGLGLVSYEFDLWNRLGSMNEAARAMVLATEAAQRTVRLALISEVAITYYALQELEQRRALMRQALSLREKSNRLLQLARESGFASRFDTLGADSAQEGARAELSQVERQLAVANNRLQLLLGQATYVVRAFEPTSSADAAIEPIPGLPAETLLARPDVLEAEQRLQAAHANIGAARAAFLPRILLTAGLGLASPSLLGLFAPGTAAWNFQPSATLPIFDQGRAQGGVDLASARKNLAVADYEKILQEAFREVADLLAMRKMVREQQQLAESQWQISKDRLANIEAREKQGYASRMNVFDMERELLTQQQAVILARRLLLENSAVVFKALGGGEQAEAGAAAR